MNINEIDLNLLRILNAIFWERNVSRAAARLNLSQPRVSNALAQSRSVFGSATRSSCGPAVACRRPS
jgi:hypothetical protein